MRDQIKAMIACGINPTKVAMVFDMTHSELLRSYGKQMPLWHRRFITWRHLANTLKHQSFGSSLGLDGKITQRLLLI